MYLYMNRLFEFIEKTNFYRALDFSIPSFLIRIVVNPIISLLAQINDKVNALTFE